MIALRTTWDTVVMLLVAGGVGLLGGVGAALLEWKKESSAPVSRSAPKGGGYWFLNVVNAVVLGGIAAVAIIYFFPPIKEVEDAEGVERFYDLLRLVPLSLIVGTAGTAFLQSMQTRALSTLNAARAETTQAAAKAEIGGVAAEAPKAAKSGIEESSQLEKALVEAGIAAEKTPQLLGQIAQKAAAAVEEELEPRADAARRAVAAAAALPGSDPTGGSKGTL